MPPEDAQAEGRRHPRIGGWRAGLLVLMLLGLGAALAFGVHRYLSFEEFARYREALLAWQDRHEASAVLAFIGTYVVVVALSLPGAIWLTIIGGFLFGTFQGALYSMLAATAGAVVAFLAARYIVGDRLRSRAADWIGRMDRGFHENAFNYMLVLRLLPIFPFWLVNVVPAFLDVRLRTFILGTVLGIVPASVVYALVGNGLGAVFAAGEKPNLDIVFKPQVLAPIVGLAALSLAPVVYRRMRARRADAPAPEGRP